MDIVLRKQSILLSKESIFLLPYRMFLIDDGGRPYIVAKALMVIPCSLQSYNIRLRTAIIVFIAYPSLRD